MAKRQTTEDIEVKVARTGGKVETVSLEDGATVEDALEAAGVDYSGKTRIRVNGEPAELDDTLEDGDRLTVTGKITGGN